MPQNAQMVFLGEGQGVEIVEIRPMGEDHILPRCLHDGPIDATIAQACETADLHFPPHPWSDETIRDLVAENPDFGLCDAGEGFPAEFMREMIRRYGTCALLAWEEQKVVGFIRFYPMEVARPVGERERGQGEPILDPTLACEPAEDGGALSVHCLMTCPPYTGVIENPPPEVKEDPNFRSAQDVGGRKGIGLRLAKALVPWARERGWKRVTKVAVCVCCCKGARQWPLLMCAPQRSLGLSRGLYDKAASVNTYCLPCRWWEWRTTDLHSPAGGGDCGRG